MEIQAPYYPPVMTEADLPARAWRQKRYQKILETLDALPAVGSITEATADLERGIQHSTEEVNRWKALEEAERMLRVQLEDRLLKVALLAIALFGWAGIVTTLYLVKVWR